MKTWKIVLIVIIVIAVTVGIVVYTRKRRKAKMIEKIIASGSSITEDVLRTMSYKDVKTLYEATGLNKA